MSSKASRKLTGTSWLIPGLVVLLQQVGLFSKVLTQSVERALMKSKEKETGLVHSGTHAYLFSAKSLSFLLRRPHHPVLVPLLQACSANALYLRKFSLFRTMLSTRNSNNPSISEMFLKTCARTGLGSAVPASRLAFRTRACNTSIT